jgi:hypothetical protein
LVYPPEKAFRWVEVAIGKIQEIKDTVEIETPRETNEMII